MRILLVTFSFLPESVGGTEVYVAALAKGLAASHDTVLVAVSDPDRTGADTFEGIAVERAPTEAARELVDRWRPDVVHCHPLTGVDLLPWMWAARDAGVPIACTYHTPTLTCGRGDLLLFGESECDGLIDTRRCALCVMQDKGLPGALGPGVLGLAPESGAPPAWLPRRVRSLLSIAGQRRKGLRAWEEVRRVVDAWIAPARWVGQVLRVNGIPAERITVSRQGLASAGATQRRASEERAVPVVGFLGRLHPHKGVHILLEAAGGIPEAGIQIRIAGSGDAAYQGSLRRRFANDGRIQWLGAVPHTHTQAFLEDLEVLVVPSLVRETGPLTVLEAWAAGTPVIGSAGCGIGEWIDAFGGGATFPRGDAAALAAILARLAAGTLTLPRVPAPVRTMDDVSGEMRALYRRMRPMACTAGT